MAISDTRPPITAGPIQRALRFLKSASVSCGRPADGAAAAAVGFATGVCCWAAHTVTSQMQRENETRIENRALMGANLANVPRFATGETMPPPTKAGACARFNVVGTLALNEMRVSCRLMTQQVLAGKVGLVFGVANKRSIAWAIAKAWAAAGARLIFNYQGERLKETVEELVAEFGETTPLF